MKFNHVAHRLDSAHFDLVVDLLTSQLGFVVLRRIRYAVWLRQPGTNVDLQFTVSTTTHRDDDKQRSQVSFLSLTPREDLEKLAAWLVERTPVAKTAIVQRREPAHPREKDAVSDSPNRSDCACPTDIRDDFVAAAGNTPLITLRKTSELAGCMDPGQSRVHESGRRWPRCRRTTRCSRTPMAISHRRRARG